VVERIGTRIGNRRPGLLTGKEIVLTDRAFSRVPRHLAGRLTNKFSLFHHLDAQLSREPIVQASPGVPAVDVQGVGQQFLLSGQSKTAVAAAFLKEECIVLNGATGSNQ